VNLGLVILLVKFSILTQPPVSLLCPPNTRSAGTQKHTYPRAPDSIDHASHPVKKSVLFKTLPGQPIVATVPSLQVFRKFEFFHTRDSSNPGVQVAMREIIRA